MRYAFISIMLMLAAICAPILGQAPVDKKTPPKGKKIESLPGFKKLTIDGYTVMVRDEVLKQQDSDNYRRKPLEALEIELKLVSKVMTKQQVDIIRANVPVWVEWDVKEPLTNGRVGNAFGLYLGAHPRPIVVGKEEYYVSGVRILQMGRLTQMHQNDEAHDSVFLHEFAHAFHDLVLSYENEDVKKAFQQAMERKLYDKANYVATNEREFFAELSCAYLDSLDYFPHNRAELKQHDPVTHKLMESLWGRRKDDKGNAKKKSEFNLDLPLSGLKLGDPLSEQTVRVEDLKGRLVLVSFWESSWPDVPASLQKLQLWQDELRDFGLVVISEASWGSPEVVPLASDLKPKALIYQSGAAVPHFFNGTLAGMERVESHPHAVLFDVDGRCIYRGNVFAAEPEIRLTIGKALVAGAEIEKPAVPVKPLIESLQNGTAPTTVLPKLIGVVKNENGAAAEQARALIKQITAGAIKRLDDAEKLAKTSPLAAYEQLEYLPVTYKNTQLAARASNLLNQLKQDKTVSAEVRAKPMLEAIKKLDTTLNGRPGSFDPTQTKFQDENADTIGQLKQSIDRMRKAHAKTKALESALLIGKRYGIETR